MKIKTDCLPCMLRMIVATMHRLEVDDQASEKLLEKVLALPDFNGPNWDMTSPAIIEQIMNYLLDYMGEPDPFREIKSEMNRRAEDIWAGLAPKVRAAADPLAEAVRLSIIGNALDFMVPDSERKLEQAVADMWESNLPEDIIREFKHRMTSAKSIVILGDNSGEIVFDRVLIEEMKKATEAEIIYIVRGQPVMNDSTLTEAAEVGLDRIARVVANGIDGPVAGTILDRCAPKVARLITEADLIISKGGGNFDTFQEELDRVGPVTFMLFSKCIPIRNFFQIEIGRPVMAHF